jgi:hypothetical protein
VNIDLGSPVLDIAIGLSFVFFLLSVIASALAEFCAGVLNLRGKTLKEGLLGMIGDEQTVEDLLEHGLVRTELDKTPRKEAPPWRLWVESFLPKKLRKYERLSSYLAPEAFALALTSIYEDLKKPVPADEGAVGDQSAAKDETTAGAEAQTEAEAAVARAAAAAKRVDQLAKIKKQIALLPGSETTKTWQASLERWFDTSMERVSGWYKRKSQIATLVFAVIVAVGCNASALRIVERLDKEPAVRSAVVSAAEAETKKPCCGQESPEEKEKREEEEKSREAAGKTTGPAGEIEAAGSHLSEATKGLSDLKLPLFWGKGNGVSGSQLPSAIVGWLLTVLAISLGAPFWFDTLGKLANLRSTKKPDETAASAT